VNLAGLRHETRAIFGMGRVDPKKKTYIISINYKTLFTMFPQMWITESERKLNSTRGKLLRMALI